MKPFIHITFKTGHVYEVETAALARRAAHLPGHEITSDEAALHWAMVTPWHALYPIARLISFTPPDLSGELASASFEAADTAAAPTMPPRDEALAPIELAVSQAASEGGPLKLWALCADDDGRTTMAMAIFRGDAPSVRDYMGALITTEARHTEAAAAALALAAQRASSTTTTTH